MATTYQHLIAANLERAFGRRVRLEDVMPAEKMDDCLLFRAFGEDCTLTPAGVRFSGKGAPGVKALLVSLYALHCRPGPIPTEPLVSFKDLPDSMPYHGAFHVNAEMALVPCVPAVEKHKGRIAERFGGACDPAPLPGDFSLLLFPLPKIALHYVFYRADDEFPPSVTCLFPSDTGIHMPLDGLADVCEYTSKEIIRLSGDSGADGV